MLRIDFIQFGKLLRESIDLAALQGCDTRQLRRECLLELRKIAVQFQSCALCSGLHLRTQLAFGTFAGVLLMLLKFALQFHQVGRCIRATPAQKNRDLQNSDCCNEQQDNNFG